MNQWGANYGTSPAGVVGLAQPVFIDAGNQNSAAIEPDGSVWVWGYQTGAPRQLPDVTDAVSVVDGDGDFAALSAPSGLSGCPTDTEVWTWGKNVHGDLGFLGQVRYPVNLIGLNGLGVVQIVGASDHFIALTCTGSVYVWGKNSSDTFTSSMPGILTTPTYDAALSALTGGTSVGVQLSTGPSYASMLVDGTLYTWGTNTQGECGCGLRINTLRSPIVVHTPVPFVAIDDGGDEPHNGHVLAIDGDGNVWCWGDNIFGQCGQSGPAKVTTPTLVPGVPTVSSALAGGEYSVYLDTAGNVWTTGNNADGELGYPGPTSSSTATEILSGATEISSGAQHAVAVVPSD